MRDFGKTYRRGTPFYKSEGDQGRFLGGRDVWVCFWCCFLRVFGLVLGWSLKVKNQGVGHVAHSN